MVTQRSLQETEAVRERYARARFPRRQARGTWDLQRVLRPGREARLARLIGWSSLCLGLAEILTPGVVAAAIGVRRRPVLLRAVGLREIGTSVGILMGRRPAPGWLWARVAGDALDLAALAREFRSPRAGRVRLTAAAAGVAGMTALDFVTGRRLSRRPGTRAGGALGVTKSIAINRSPQEVYRFWRDFQNLPRFMRHLESVRVTGDRGSRWVARGPAGTTVEWDAEITEDRPNELIAWRSLPGAEVDNAGRVRFEQAPGGRGTVVRVEMQYRPPAGGLGSMIAKLFGEEPERQVRDDLRRLKQVLETGEVATSEGPSARPARIGAARAARRAA